ncbi:hypothetical protein Hanom_Chr11g01032121 [Helianthus anomalus]
MSFRWTTGGLSNERPGNEVMPHLRLSHDLNLSELFNWKNISYLKSQIVKGINFSDFSSWLWCW